MKKYIMIGEHIVGVEDIVRISKEKEKNRIEIILASDKNYTLYAYPKDKESLNTYFDKVYREIKFNE